VTAMTFVLTIIALSLLEINFYNKKPIVTNQLNILK